MSWGSEAEEVTVNGTEYRCYCNVAGVEAFTNAGWGYEVRVARSVDDIPPDDLPGKLLDLAAGVVAHAYGASVDEVWETVGGKP